MVRLKTAYIHIADAKLAFRQYGNGHPLLLLHGNSQSKNIFTQYQTDYFKMFHTFAIDSRGHGESISNSTEYSIEQFSTDIIEFCHTKAIKDTYVIGHSDGGNIALHLAHKAHELFTKIIAISPNYLVDGLNRSVVHFCRIMVNILVFFSYFGVHIKRII